MLYAVSTMVNGIKRSIPISVYNKETNTYITFKGMMASTSMMEEVIKMGYHIQIVSDSTSEISGEETLVFPVYVQGTPVLDVTGLEATFIRMPEFSDWPRLSDLLKSKGTDISPVDVENIFKGLSEKKEFTERKADYVLKIERLLVESASTISTIDAYNSKRSSVLTFLSSESNRTHIMENEYDRLFIKIPRYETLMDVEDVSELIPSVSELWKPYPHVLYNTPHMLAVFDLTMKEKISFLSSCMSRDTKCLPKMDISNIPPIPKKHVIGNSVNNTLPIREEEMEYKMGLTQLIKYDISQTFPDGDVEELYAQGRCSPQLKKYLHGLVALAMRLNWTHNNKVDIGGVMDDVDDNDDDSKEVRDEVQAQLDNSSYFNFPFNSWKEKPEFQRTEGIRIMTSFLESAVSQVGFDAMIDSIIKMFRWGELKPSVLTVEGVSNRDLNTLYNRSTSGNIACLKELPYQGFKYEAVSFINYENTFPDSPYLKNKGYSGLYTMPIGITLKLHLEEGYFQTIHMSLIDLVNLYRNGKAENLVYGIKYENGKFESTIPDSATSNVKSLPTVVREVNSDQESLTKFETSPECKSVILNQNIGKVEGLSTLETTSFGYSMNNLLSELYDLVKITSLPEAVDKSLSISQTVSNILRINSLHFIIPILEEVQKLTQDYSEIPVAALLNAYLEAMEKTGYTSEFQYLNEVSGAPKESVMREESMKLASFAKSEEEGTTIQSAQDLKTIHKDSWFVPIQPTERIRALNFEGKPFCGVVVRDIGKPKKLQILVGASKIPEDSVPMNTPGVLVVAALINSINMLAEEGESFTKFASEADSAEIFSMLTTTFAKKG